MNKLLTILFILLIILSCNNIKEKTFEKNILPLLITSKKAINDQLNKPFVFKHTDIDYSDKKEGVIVRLLKNHKERGCAGFISNIANLDEAVKTSAINASFFDTRFTPLKVSELNNLEIDIALFCPWIKMKNYNDFKLGEDSVMIEGDFHRVLIQGYIALEEKYNKKQYLEAICKKDGMNTSWYKNKDVKLYKSKTIHYRMKFKDIPINTEK